MLGLGSGWCIAISVVTGFIGILLFAIFCSSVNDEYHNLPLFEFELTKKELKATRKTITILGLIACLFLSISAYGIKFACTKANETDREIIELYNQPTSNKKSEVLYEGVEVPKTNYYDFVVKGKNGGQDLLELYTPNVQIYYDDINEVHIERVEYTVKNLLYKHVFEKYYIYFPLKFKEAS